MAEKPNKAKPRNPKLTDAERHERFIQTLGEVRASTSEKDFEKAFSSVVSGKDG